MPINDVSVTNDAEGRRYEALVEQATVAGFVEYQETSELVVLTHTEVDPSFEGRGIGSALARAALDDIRERRLKALVICPSSSAGCATTPSTRACSTTRHQPRSASRSRTWSIQQRTSRRCRHGSTA